MTIRILQQELVVVATGEETSPPIWTGREKIYRFGISRPISTYLIVVNVGSFEYRALPSKLPGRSGIWAESSLIEAAAWEYKEMDS